MCPRLPLLQNTPTRRLQKLHKFWKPSGVGGHYEQPRSFLPAWRPGSEYWAWSLWSRNVDRMHQVLKASGKSWVWASVHSVPNWNKSSNRLPAAAWSAWFQMNTTRTRQVSSCPAHKKQSNKTYHKSSLSAQRLRLSRERSTWSAP